MHMNPFGMFGSRTVIIALVVVAVVIGLIAGRRK